LWLWVEGRLCLERQDFWQPVIRGQGERDPIYCDRIISRYEAYAKDEAELVACGLASPPAIGIAAE
jgi:hypothetical protein